MSNKKVILASVVAVAFVSIIIFGLTMKETWAGYGSKTGIAPAGDPMYMTPILYDARDWGLMGYYQDTLSGVDFGLGEMAMIWAFSRADGAQCATGFRLSDPNKEPLYSDACWDSAKLEWIFPHAQTSDPRKFRIINVITNDIQALSDVQKF